VTVGHDSATAPSGSTVVGFGAPGFCGLNVACSPTASTAVHRVTVGHETEVMFASD
jgi:hypothetical protein